MLPDAMRLPEPDVYGIPFSITDLNIPCVLDGTTPTGLENAYVCVVPFEYMNVFVDNWEHV